MNEGYYDYLRTLKVLVDIVDYNLKPTHITTPDGTKHKLEDLFKELEEYEKENE